MYPGREPEFTLESQWRQMRVGADRPVIGITHKILFGCLPNCHWVIGVCGSDAGRVWQGGRSPSLGVLFLGWSWFCATSVLAKHR